MTAIARSWRLALAMSVAGLLVACSSLQGGSEPTSLQGGSEPTPPPGTPGPSSSPGARVVIAPDQMRLEVANETTIDVRVTVNGQPGLRVPAGHSLDVGTAVIGPLPWAAQVRTLNGRVLVQTVVHAGEVWTEQGPGDHRASNGVGARVDLSCGRIDIWSGSPMLGPPPGPGTPGDCDP